MLLWRAFFSCILLIYLMAICRYCKRPFKSAHALGIHRPTCIKRRQSHEATRVAVRASVKLARLHVKKKKKTAKTPQATDSEEEWGGIIRQGGPDIDGTQERQPEERSFEGEDRQDAMELEDFGPASSQNRSQPAQAESNNPAPPSPAQTGPRRSARLAPNIVPDQPPVPRPPVPRPSSPIPHPTTPNSTPPSSSPAPPTFTTTEPDEFGIYAVYKDLPQRDPIAGEDVACDAATFNVAHDTSRDPLAGFGSEAMEETSNGNFGPFKNWTLFSLMRWAYNTTLVTGKALNRLVHDVLLMPQFDAADLEGFSAAREMKMMDDYSNPTADTSDDPGDPERPQDGWRTGTIRLPMPKATKKKREEDAPCLEIPNVQYRDILEVTKAAFRDPSVTEFNIKGHILMVDRGADEPPERVHGEAYTADAVLEYEEEIRNRPDAADCQLETVVAIWILYSDSTHLANFGTASLWPIYGWLANISKYVRVKTSKFAAHHLAYLPKLPDAVYDAYRMAYNAVPLKSTIAQLRRDLFHAVWRLILTPALAEAYCHGIVIMCGDGVLRRVFPRFLLYSADYPEKMLIAAIRSMTKHLCPRCNITTDKAHLMGTKQDEKRRETLKRQDTPKRISFVKKARDWMFRKGVALKNAAVQVLLAFGSQAPIISAFSSFLFPLGVNYYSLLAVDLLHEFELGVWKSLMIHLVRMCVLFGPQTVRKLDQRYRAIRPFGRSVIRRFRNNVSEMKNFAARDFEDLLQCAEPVFEGLFPEPYNELTLDLLGWMATWHAYAKMRMHTDSTLRSFKKATAALGKSARRFSNKTSELKTRELVKETRARKRSQQRRKSTQPALASSGRKQRASAANRNANDEDEDESASKHWNINTFKFHSLGYHVPSIPRYGTSDSHNAENGEAEHRRLKQFYKRTNRNQPEAQIARHVRRQQLLKAIEKKQGRRALALSADANEPLPKTNPHERYQVSHSTRFPEDLSQFVNENAGDPAVEDFIPKLKNHLLARILGGDEEEDFNEDDRDTLLIFNNRIYKHKTIRFNYTTYDMRRKQDSCNPRTQADVMVLNPSADKAKNPYWFTRITGIIHLQVLHKGPRSKSQALQTFDVLTVRWFGADDRQKKWGLHVNRNPRIGFVPADSESAFGFVDPAAVLRACHIVPAFHYGYDDNGLARSIGRPRHEVDDKDQPDMDWAYYYVLMYADRDMVMRFRGGGIGHKSTREATREFEKQNYVAPDADPDSAESDENDSENDMDTEEVVMEEVEEYVSDDDMGNEPAEPQGAGDNDEGDEDSEEESDPEDGTEGSEDENGPSLEGSEEEDGADDEEEDEDAYYQ
ncbi:hypothetical protein C8F01DRAFT_1330682 [Mycena amicta]|nr:hypothetical protein C8F01DRAFT_1330682 [Mycena amicta]